MKLKKELPLLVLVAIPFIYLGIIWNQLPESVPMHWNIQGEIDRYGPKSQVWILPAITSGLIYLILLVVPAIDPKKKIAQMGRKYDQLKFALVASMSALACVIIYMIQQGESAGTTPILVIVGLLIAVLGNYMKTVQPNYFIGIRTPWTLEHPEVWEKTHKLGGKLWFAGGILMIVLAFLTGSQWQLYLILGLPIILAVIPLVYSYQEYRRLTADKS
ncbi:Uncharacterized membrane protein [Robiginitalea myxolifaciens]|uniref:Uncharacterized membrane protein n=1 Tax=Robiginitalea myxolifaciens TaxID=400055 RepID=A0A1I6G838_9FLAO|nr:SdpI family protein [Robiginitalea myxolifaciens]SFR38344.1 Uncharacterized membrane protein [Robiginitalea myxolifaciens]